MVTALGFTSSVLHKSISLSNRTVGKSIERLATGLRINSGADDAAGLALSQTLMTSIKGYEVVEKNLGDGMSLVDTADAGLANISSELGRVRELVVQAKNDTYGTADLDAMQSEINEKLANIDSIASGTSFNGKGLLDGTTGSLSIVSSADGSSTTDVDLSGDFSSTASDSAGSINEGNSGGSAGVALSNIDITSGNLDDILTGIDNALENVSDARSGLGASYNTLEAKYDSVSTAKEAAISAHSRVIDADYSKEVSSKLSAYIKRSASATLSSADTANAALALNLLPLVRSY